MSKKIIKIFFLKFKFLHFKIKTNYPKYLIIGI